MKTTILIAVIVAAAAARGQRMIYINPTEGCSSGIGLAVVDGLRARVASAPGYRLATTFSGAFEVDIACVHDDLDTAVAASFNGAYLTLYLAGNGADAQNMVNGLFANITQYAPLNEVQPAYVPKTKCKPNASGVMECR